MIRRPKSTDLVVTAAQAAAPSARPMLCPNCKGQAAPATLADGRSALLCGRCKAQFLVNPL